MNMDGDEVDDIDEIGDNEIQEEDGSDIDYMPEIADSDYAISEGDADLYVNNCFDAAEEKRNEEPLKVPFNLCWKGLMKMEVHCSLKINLDKATREQIREEDGELRTEEGGGRKHVPCSGQSGDEGELGAATNGGSDGELGRRPRAAAMATRRRRSWTRRRGSRGDGEGLEGDCEGASAGAGVEVDQGSGGAGRGETDRGRRGVVDSKVVLKTSIYPNKRNVAFGTIRSTGPRTKAGGIELGAEFSLVCIDQPVIDNEELVREVSDCKAIVTQGGVTKAPFCCSVASAFALENGISLVTVCPGLMVGAAPTAKVNPIVLDALSLLSGDDARVYTLKFIVRMSGSIPLVHVDDVCRAEIFVAEEEEASGRYICCNINTTVVELACFLAAKYPEYNVKTNRHVRNGRLDSSLPSLPRACVSSVKLLGQGFEYKYKNLGEIYEDIIKYGKDLTFISRQT
ncbi:Leucoanthocyanidin reductase [Hordeum vulgare]|nr:Leucoanthocyanidin reductase [Hordeum vulgare]